MTKSLVLLFFVMFVAMTGYGVTLPALPFFVERLGLGPGASSEVVAFHVGSLTGAYALGQLLASPFWGGWSDRRGRKFVLLLGLVGFAFSQAVFALLTTLPLLYTVRLVGGVFSAAILTSGSTYVADLLPAETRGAGMAWFGTALSMGFVVGPALSGLLVVSDWHVVRTGDHFVLDGFSIPFFGAAAAAFVTLPLVAGLLPESLLKVAEPKAGSPRVSWIQLVRQMKDILLIVLLSQTALALFESVFALFAQQALNFSVAEIGYSFAVCGIVMAVFQGGLVTLLTGRFEVGHQIAAGLVLVSLGLISLAAVGSLLTVLFVVGLIAVGFAVVSPNLMLLAANRSDPHVGTGIGLRNTVGSLGQVIGPVVGGLLFGWGIAFPFSVAASASLIAAIWILRGGLRQ